jgi:hypothetical protein
MAFIVYLASEEFGREPFKYDNQREQLAGAARLVRKAANARDRVEREIIIKVTEEPDNS